MVSHSSFTSGCTWYVFQSWEKVHWWGAFGLLTVLQSSLCQLDDEGIISFDAELRGWSCSVPRMKERLRGAAFIHSLCIDFSLLAINDLDTLSSLI